MRSPRSAHARRLALAALLLAGGARADSAPAAASSAGPLTRDDIHAAVTQVAADPNLSGEQKIRQLRWTRSDAPRSTPRPADSVSWGAGLFGFLAQSLSFILWTAGIVGVAFAAIWIIRWLRSLPPEVPPEPPAPVRSVCGLDIRPASLPEDIGAAALELLQAHRTRDALSLLYRGALSRAVHSYGAAIGASFTEGEALRAANARLDPPRAAYVADLVGVWQRTVYAGEAAARDTVERLCRGFAPAMDGAAP